MADDVKHGPCNPACTKIVKFMTDHEVPAGVGISLPPYTGIDGYRYINIFVQFDQTAANEPPVDLGVVFAFDANGSLGARRYVNLEQNLSGPQSTNFIEVSGSGSWHGTPPDQQLLGAIPRDGAVRSGVRLQSSANQEKGQRVGLLGFLS